MADATAIRKQVYELRPGDLEQFAIWEHVLDEEGWTGQDEATVKPRPDLAEADPGKGMFIVRAEFVAHDGSRFDGYVYPALDFTLGVLQPTVVTEEGQVNFWYGGFVPRPTSWSMTTQRSRRRPTSYSPSASARSSLPKGRDSKEKFRRFCT